MKLQRFFDSNRKGYNDGEYKNTGDMRTEGHPSIRRREETFSSSRSREGTFASYRSGSTFSSHRTSRIEEPVIMPNRHKVIMMDDEKVSMDVVVDYLMSQLPRLARSISQLKFTDAEIGLSMLHTTKVYFSVFDNIKSPYLLLIVCERIYNEFCLVHSKNSGAVENLADMVCVDLEIMYDIFSDFAEPTSLCEDTQSKSPTPLRSDSSSASSNFSLISMVSQVCEEEYVQLTSGQIDSPPVFEQDDYVTVEPVLGTKSFDNEPETTAPLSSTRKYEPLLALLQDMLVFARSRVEMLNIFATLKFTAWTASACDQLVCRLDDVSVAQHVADGNDTKALLEWIQGEARCLSLLLQCRGFILTGNYVQSVIACQQTGILITARIREVESLLMDMTPHSSITFSEDSANSGSTCLPMLKWMWQCYIRFVVLIPIIFSEKRKTVLGKILGPAGLEEANHMQHGTHTTPPSHAHTFLPPARHGTILAHDPDVMAAAASMSSVALERTVIKKAIDNFFRVSRGIYRRVALVLVVLSSDRNQIEKQYVCPPRDMWNTSSSALNPTRRSSLRGLLTHTQEEHDLKSVPGTPALGSPPRSVLASQSSDDDDGHAHALSSVGAVGGSRKAELAVLSQLTPTVPQPTPLSTTILDRRQSSTYHSNARRLMGLVNGSNIVTSSSQTNIPAFGEPGTPRRTSSGNIESSLSPSPGATGIASQSLMRRTSGADGIVLANASTVKAAQTQMTPSGSQVTPDSDIELTEDVRLAAPSTSTPPTQAPASAAAAPDNGEWINDHMNTIQAILEYNFLLQATSPSGRADSCGAHNTSYESFDRILSHVHRRRCLCMPMFNSANPITVQESQTQRAQRSSPGIYIIAPLNDVASYEGLAGVKSYSPSFRGDGDSAGTSGKSASHMQQKTSLPPRLFLIGAAMDRVAPVQPHSSQYLDDGGRSMGECVREICEMLAVDDVFSRIGGLSGDR